LDEIRDELEIRQACVADLKQVRSHLTTHQGRLTLMVSNLNQKLAESESNLAKEQKMFLKLNADVESAIGRLKIAVNEANLQDGNFLIEDILSPLFEENERVREMICQLIRKRFDEPLGRDVEEFDNLVAEIDRLRFSIKNVEQQQILSEAKCEGARAGLEETKYQLKLLSQDMLPKDNMENEMSKIENEIQNLQGELKSLSTDVLPRVIEERVAGQCRKILSKDLKGKTERQNYIIEQLQIILQLLLELTSCHEVLGGFMLHESKFLQKLENCLVSVQEFNVRTKCELDEQYKITKDLQEKETLMKRSTLMPEDKSLLALFKMVAGKELDPSMITHNDIIGLLDNLAKDHSSIGEQINIQTRNWTEKRDEIRSNLHSLLMNFGISGDSKGYNLSSDDTRTKIKTAQTEVTKLECDVKEAIIGWENACKNMKENPLIKMEKGLWKDFVINPTAMEKTVETMKSLQQKTVQKK